MTDHFIYLGVNIDHVATLRQARGTRYPEPVQAALVAEQAGADSITMHLREDRRHIQDYDVYRVKEMAMTRLNLEMAMTPAMVEFAVKLQPDDVCLVPERRQELTTEGGLDVAGQQSQLKEVCQQLAEAGVRVSLFIDPEIEQVDAAVAVNAPVIEIHTGQFAAAKTPYLIQQELKRIEKAVEYGANRGLQVNAGHGLHYHNVIPIARLPQIRELNIGHAIVARAIFSGFAEAVREMKGLMVKARRFI